MIMNIFLIILLSISTCFSVFMLVKSAKNAHELPDSASSFSYHYNNKIFTIWCVILAITCLHILPFKLWYLSALQFIGLLMVISDGSPIGAKEIYQSPLTPFYVIFILLLFIFACGLYAWHYLPKNQGKVWTFNQVKEGDRKKTWWNNFAIAFAGATIIPSLLTGYIQNAFGILLGILLTLTLPAIMVDAVYAAIYVKKHPINEISDII